MAFLHEAAAAALADTPIESFSVYNCDTELILIERLLPSLNSEAHALPPLTPPSLALSRALLLRKTPVSDGNLRATASDPAEDAFEIYFRNHLRREVKRWNGSVEAPLCGCKCCNEGCIRATAGVVVDIEDRKRGKKTSEEGEGTGVISSDTGDESNSIDEFRLSEGSGVETSMHYLESVVDWQCSHIQNWFHGLREETGVAFLGVIKLLNGFYAALVTEARLAATLGDHKIYSVEKTEFIPCCYFHFKTRPSSAQVRERALDQKYLRLLGSLFASMRGFFFSSDWDLTRTVQQQIQQVKTEPTTNTPRDTVTISPTLPTTTHGGDSTYTLTRRVSRSGFSRGRSMTVARGGAVAATADSRFVYNALMLSPFLRPTQGAAPLEWLSSVIQGDVQQTPLRLLDSDFSFTVIARRSRYQAGPRYFKRGLDAHGCAANEVESEQILWETTPTHVGTFSDAKSPDAIHGRRNASASPVPLLPIAASTRGKGSSVSKNVSILRIASVVALRASIPLVWGHEDSSSIRPRLRLYEETSSQKTQSHFRDLLQRYGAPVVILDLVKQRPLVHPEAVLSAAYRRAIAQLRLDSGKDGCTAKSVGEDSVPRYRRPRHHSRLEPSSPPMPRGGSSSVIGHWEESTESTTATNSTRQGARQMPVYYLNYDWAYEAATRSFEGALRALMTLTGLMLDHTGLNAQCFVALEDEGNPSAGAQHSLLWRRAESITRDPHKDEGAAPFSPSRVAQRGICRINCIDCLDRTNLAMMALGLEALRRQLVLLSQVGSAEEDADSFSLPGDVVASVSKVWGAVGDAVATAYAGSPAMHRADVSLLPPSPPTPALSNNDMTEEFDSRHWQLPPSEAGDFTLRALLSKQHKQGNNHHPARLPALTPSGWTAVSKSNTVVAFQRYLHNWLSDLDRQRGLDVLLGRFRPCNSRPSIWELELFRAAAPDENTGESDLPLIQDAPPYANNECGCAVRNGDQLFGWLLNLCGEASTAMREPDVEIVLPAHHLRRRQGGHPRLLLPVT